MKRVTAWQIVGALIALDPNLRHSAAALVQQPGPSRGESRTALAWLQAIKDQHKRNSEEPLESKGAIVALAQMDPGLEQYLSASGFLEGLRPSRGTSNDNDYTMSGSIGTNALPDPTPLHLDSPAADDRLGRRGFARALAVRLDRIWNEYSRANAKGSFVLHMHGPWGSGKTSLLNLLHKELQPSNDSGQDTRGPSTPAGTAGPDVVSRWIVVDFNAWQHQRLDPPWWFLMDAIYRQAREQISSRYRSPLRAWRLRLFENVWRLFTGRRDVITVFAVLVMAAGLLYWPLLFVLHQIAPDLKSIGEGAKHVSDALALGSTVLSAAVLLSRSLISGSARAAQEFVQAGADPMERISRHFHDLVGHIRQPILIFIDDLDRCQGDYVVRLLEGIQTLFYDPRVIYLVAADRRWLHASFEKRYEQFASSVKEPGRALGSLFLDKAFELSVSVPGLSPEQRKKYWRELLEGASNRTEERRRKAEEAARAEFATATSEHEVIERLKKKGADPVVLQARRQAAVERLASARVEKSTQYFLEQFANLLEANPRAMKRLLNGYSIQRDLVLLADGELLGNTDMRKKLALWTILCLRWPAAEEYLLKRAAGRMDDLDDGLRDLLNSEAVKAVLDGNGIGVKLDLESIGRLVGILS
jgi:hypothetical protein